MSIPVELERLEEEAARFGPVAYLLTTGDDGRPHAVAAGVAWEAGHMVLEAGRKTRHNATERPRVSLLWPPPEAGGYTLIVDGTAETAGEEVRIRPTRGVLHRPGTAPPERPSCTSDCVPLLGG